MSYKIKVVPDSPSGYIATIEGMPSIYAGAPTEAAAKNALAAEILDAYDEYVIGIHEAVEDGKEVREEMVTLSGISEIVEEAVFQFVRGGKEDHHAG